MASLVQSPVIQAPAVQAPAVTSRTRSAARSVSRAGALADLSRSRPEQHPRLVHDPQLRLQRRHRNLHLHFRLHRGLRLWPGHGRARLHRRRRAHPEASLADLRGARLPVRDLHRRDRLCRVELRESALRRGNERARLPQDAGRHDHPGAAAQVQAGEHGRAAALYRAADDVPAGALAADPQRHGRAGAFGRALRRDLGVRLEHRVLAERALVLQSVRLAAFVRVRRLVRARRRDAAGAGACARRSRSGWRSLICCSRSASP